MIRARINGWKEIAYFESGKWQSCRKKRCNDHNKLARLCKDGHKIITRKFKDVSNTFIHFGINIAGNK